MADEIKRAEAEPVKSNKLHKKKRVIIPVLLTVLAACAVAVWWYLYLRSYISTDDAYIDSDAITISSKILGRITELTVDEGDTIKQSQLLVQLDDSDLKAQEAQATAGLEYAQQNVSLAKINLDRAQEDFDRSSKQINDKVITREQFDHAGKALDMARAQYKVALSQVNSAQAQVHVIETQLGNTGILSPAKAVVAKKWVVPGDIVQPAQPIYTMYDLDDVWVTANFEETKLSSIHLGDQVQIAVDAYPDNPLTGKVALIGAAAASQFSLIPPNNASGNFTKVTQRVPVRIMIIASPSAKAPDSPMPLLPGMSVEVKIKLQSP